MTQQTAHNEPSIEDVMALLRASAVKPAPKALDPNPPTEELPRHPLTYIDTWSLIGALACAIGVTTSLATGVVIQYLVYGIIAFLVMALIGRLTNDRTVITVFKIQLTGIPLTARFNPRLAPISELQKRAGIKPQLHTTKGEAA